MISKKAIIISIIIVISSVFLYESNYIQKIMYPKEYSEYVEKYAKEYNIDPDLVYSVMKAESKFKKDAMSHKGAKGLMQISDITRDWAIEELELGEIDIFDPETNIMIGCWYINKLYKEFGDMDLVVAAYNGGSGNVQKWLNDEEYSRNGKDLDNIPFNETSTYLKKVKKNYERYKEIYS